MKRLFITATNTDVGKTYTTLKLIEAFARQGIRVGVCKPIETGVIEEPLDAKLLLDACQKVNPDFRRFQPKDITAYTFSLPAAPFCADTSETIEVSKIIDKINTLERYCDLLLIEGAGGLMVPITKDFFMIDLIAHAESDVLLVCSSKLGCINDTLLSREALKKREISYDWCVNLYHDLDSFDLVTRPFYDTYFDHWSTIKTLLNHTPFYEKYKN